MSRLHVALGLNYCWANILLHSIGLYIYVKDCNLLYTTLLWRSPWDSVVETCIEKRVFNLPYILYKHITAVNLYITHIKLTLFLSD